MKNASTLFIAFNFLGFLLIGCSNSVSSPENTIEPNAYLPDSTVTKSLSEWDTDKLAIRAKAHLDTAKWDKALFQQDIETYADYPEVFQNYRINKSPFPVAEYEYAVSSLPFTMEKSGSIFKGIRVGEYETFDSEVILDKLTLIVLTNDKDAEELTMVESRNYPYLTAQGFFKVKGTSYDWVFAASPDGFATLLINMKLFDLRFGETIIIYPQSDHSFFYDQIEYSPNNYSDFEEFKSVILNKTRVVEFLNSEKKR